jgi:hypothetical protein
MELPLVQRIPIATGYSLIPVPYSLFYLYLRSTPSTRPCMATCAAGR